MGLLFILSILAGSPYGTNSTSVDAYIRQLESRNTNYVQRVVETAKAGLGTPYSDGPLGEGPDGEYDTDPLIDLTKVDCVTYVEQCLALAAGQNYNDAVTKLQQIRYAGGTIDFAHRNHFMVADWLENNPWCVDQSARLGLPVETLTRTISKRDFFTRVKAPGLGEGMADRAVSIKYIPTEHGHSASVAIRTPSIVVFIGKIDWLFALHCGLYLPDEQGGGRLYHASSQAGQVAAVDLGDYVASQSKRYLGFIVYEITPPPFAHEATVPAGQ